MKRAALVVRLIIVFFVITTITSCGSSESGDSGGSNGLVLLDDNFDGENSGVAAGNYVDFSNWDVSDGTVDLIGNGVHDLIPGNGLYVDIDGSTFDAGKMTTKTSFTLVPGFTYELQFDLAGNQRNSSVEEINVQVGMGVVFSEAFSLNQSDPFTTFTRQLEVTMETTTVISFEGLGGDNIGILLDNIKLTRL